jgi:hypothetical protein
LSSIQLIDKWTKPNLHYGNFRFPFFFLQPTVFVEALILVIEEMINIYLKKREIIRVRYFTQISKSRVDVCHMYRLNLGIKIPNKLLLLFELCIMFYFCDNFEVNNTFMNVEQYENWDYNLSICDVRRMIAKIITCASN